MDSYCLNDFWILGIGIIVKIQKKYFCVYHICGIVYHICGSKLPHMWYTIPQTWYTIPQTWIPRKSLYCAAMQHKKSRNHLPCSRTCSRPCSTSERHLFGRCFVDTLSKVQCITFYQAASGTICRNCSGTWPWSAK